CAPAPIYVFYGYGNITILFDSERTEARVAEIERKKEHALAVLKALGDRTRLEILRLIAQHEDQINGKRLAAKLKLSPSAVSRHLAQLKEAGLLVESSPDNRAITYRLQREALTGLPDVLLEVFYH
ncbi:MAG TPA: ArsR family transcriptional regulator, partial [Armatimonadetes bacterium]|nr:ArsR family transcriptional regulator [Armatimonadota bacterium]